VHAVAVANADAAVEKPLLNARSIYIGVMLLPPFHARVNCEQFYSGDDCSQ